MRPERQSTLAPVFRGLLVTRGMLIGAVFLGGCAAMDFSNDCTELRGTYSNHGTPDERLLTDILFNKSATKGGPAGVASHFIPAVISQAVSA